MKRITIKEIFASPEKFAGQKITVAGWARTIRASNVFGFIELNDGSYFKNLQVVFEDAKLENYKTIAKLESNSNACSTRRRATVVSP